MFKRRGDATAFESARDSAAASRDQLDRRAERARSYHSISRLERQIENRREIERAARTA
jgi:hypothetical protein